MGKYNPVMAYGSDAVLKIAPEHHASAERLLAYEAAAYMKVLKVQSYMVQDRRERDRGLRIRHETYTRTIVLVPISLYREHVWMISSILV